jgi:hypothetical protein
LFQAAAHSISQGILSVVQGGDFLQAFASGGFSSLGAAAFGLMGGSFANSAVGTVVFGAIAGGIGSVLTGGNFWQGVVIGGIVAGLNHAFHKTSEPQNKENDNGDDKGYKIPRKIITFSKTQPAYIPVEGLGIFGTYTISGTMIIEGNMLTVNVYGDTIASTQGQPFFKGNVSVSGTSKFGGITYNVTKPLVNDYSKSFVHPANKQYVGQAEFYIPTKISAFNVRITAGYMIFTSDNQLSAPYPNNTIFNYGINRNK